MSAIKTVFKEIFFFFTPYVNGTEWKVNRFCSWVTSYRSKNEVEKRLLALMQKDLIVTSVWLEKKYKSYNYLTKNVRRKLYKNAELMKADFSEFVHGRTVANKADTDPREYINQLMKYFSPSRGQYVYKEGMSFGKLLADPKTEKFVGDCNQIVTLYAAFYALKFPIQDLMIKLIPGHVCLHFRGEDVEATSGTWKKYDSYDYIAPITELVSTNLLDISEAGEKTGFIDPEVFVKGAQLSALLSQKRDLVERNVRVAYHNLCARALEQKNLTKARFYAQKLGDQKLLRACASAEYSELYERLRTVKTVQEAANKKSTYQRMLELAREIGNTENVRSIEKILDQIRKAR